eukprot:CAMPEP_0172577192 /NCGR_PEP_ID=MMETSP1067-20121228/138108_1 /TAXON_ID=265564 ORGANISM="Thalassiosira punctigera, Strain Tpunct2005C2" /NCGR_SAMPLE_ID=MMETSP1067 /ASSEMBLY_ACC=CAM_ASM_000444 /LENGTH=72 /DNA_ID=CAMNT_0013369877 /DNA_START=581 /DNA_END=796 /DNA_ORIENTATION=-
MTRPACGMGRKENGNDSPLVGRMTVAFDDGPSRAAMMTSAFPARADRHPRRVERTMAALRPRATSRRAARPW